MWLFVFLGVTCRQRFDEAVGHYHLNTDLIIDPLIIQARLFNSDLLLSREGSSERRREIDTLRIYTFGGFQVYRNHELIDGFPTRKAESLFCYLILNRHRFHPREVLATLFWGESEPKNARHCLCTTLWRLRRVLESNPSTNSYLLIGRDQIRFNPESCYWLDAEEFEGKIHLAEGVKPADMNEPQLLALEEAVKLYRGDFLDGFCDDWCLYERERLQQMLLRTLAKLMVDHGREGRYEKGIAHGQRILSLDPLREEVHRELMRYHLLAGRRACAVQQFHVCRGVLREEMDIEPMPETWALYRKMQNQRWDEEETLGEYDSPSTPPTNHTIAQLRMAVERLDETKRQLCQAITAVEKLSKTPDHKI